MNGSSALTDPSPKIVITFRHGLSIADPIIAGMPERLMRSWFVRPKFLRLP